MLDEVGVPGATPPRYLILNYFAAHTLQDILEAVSEADFPADIVVVIGSYGISAEAAEAIHQIERVRYAPLFSIQPHGADDLSSYYKGRLPTAFTTDEWTALEAEFDAQIPLAAEGVPLPRESEFGWGRELGRRYRDALRFGRRRLQIDHWQFDEVVSQAATAHELDRDRYLDYLAGILTGVHQGRIELDDQPEQGVVWVAGQAIRACPRSRSRAKRPSTASGTHLVTQHSYSLARNTRGFAMTQRGPEITTARGRRRSLPAAARFGVRLAADTSPVSRPGSTIRSIAGLAGESMVKAMRRRSNGKRDSSPTAPLLV